MARQDRKNKGLSAISAAFIENDSFLRKFLNRFFADPHDIDDVIQEAYLRSYVAEQKKAIEQPKAFMFRVAKNVALTRLTRKSNQITEYLEESGVSAIVDRASTPDLEAEARESFGLYCDAVETLSRKCRDVFLLRKVHGLSHREIAEVMSLSVSSVEKYLREGILACKTRIDKAEQPRASGVRHRHDNGARKTGK